ncbi:MAG: hypothetical protein AAGF31_10775, partial [Planctomycetota bacterium]
VGFNDRLAKPKRISGAGFDTVVGHVDEQLVVSATPTDEPADFQRILAAMIAAYRPGLVIGAGFSAQASATAPVGSKILADRVINATGDALQLSQPPTRMNDITIGSLQEVSGDAARRSRYAEAVATNHWCYQFAGACAAVEQPATIVTVVSDADGADVDPDVENVLRQKTAAAKAGAVVRAAWRKPASLLTLVQRKSDGWQRQELLADAIAEVIRVAR